MPIHKFSNFIFFWKNQPVLIFFEDWAESTWLIIFSIWRNFTSYANRGIVR